MTTPPVLVVHSETRLPAVLLVMVVSPPLKPVLDALNRYADQSSQPDNSAIPAMERAINGTADRRRECPLGPSSPPARRSPRITHPPDQTGHPAWQFCPARPHDATISRRECR